MQWYELAGGTLEARHRAGRSLLNSGTLVYRHGDKVIVGVSRKHEASLLKNSGDYPGVEMVPRGATRQRGHPPPLKWKCNHCPASFGTEQGLVDHHEVHRTELETKEKGVEKKVAAGAKLAGFSTLEERNAEIVRLRGLGRTYSQIAEPLGITTTLVGFVLRDAGAGKKQDKAIVNGGANGHKSAEPIPEPGPLTVSGEANSALLERLDALETKALELASAASDLRSGLGTLAKMEAELAQLEQSLETVRGALAGRPERSLSNKT